MTSSQESQLTLVEKNRQFFDTASTHVFTEKWIQDLQAQISKHLSSNLSWLGINETHVLAPGDEGKEEISTKMLDYACGNGIPSQTLSPYMTTCIGLDVSAGMLKSYNAAAASLGLGPSRMRGIQGDLMATDVDPTLLTAEMSDFDLVVISMALHHIEDWKEAIRRLVERAKVGGRVVIIDWAKLEGEGKGKGKGLGELMGQEGDAGVGGEDQHQLSHHHHHQQRGADGKHPAAHTVAHHSFSRSQMEEGFKEASCDEIDYVLHDEPSDVPGVTSEMRLFFAKGRKMGVAG